MCTKNMAPYGVSSKVMSKISCVILVYKNFKKRATHLTKSLIITNNLPIPQTKKRLHKRFLEIEKFGNFSI